MRGGKGRLGGCGGAPTTVWSQTPTLVGFAVSSTSIYWTYANGVMGCGVDDCASTVMPFLTAGAQDFAIALGGTTVYWFDSWVGSPPAIWAAPLGGGPAVRSLSPVLAAHHPIGIAADALGVYSSWPGSGCS